MSFLFLFACSFASAANLCESSFDQEVAPITEIMKERKNIDRWKKYEAFLKKFDTCLDGAYAETVQGISEDGLANDWDGFIHYVLDQNPDPKILHSDIQMGFSVEMGLSKNLKLIQKNARAKCPKQIISFCREINNANVL